MVRPRTRQAPRTPTPIAAPPSPPPSLTVPRLRLAGHYTFHPRSETFRTKTIDKVFGVLWSTALFLLLVFLNIGLYIVVCYALPLILEWLEETVCNLKISFLTRLLARTGRFMGEKVGLIAGKFLPSIVTTYIGKLVTAPFSALSAASTSIHLLITLLWSSLKRSLIFLAP